MYPPYKDHSGQNPNEGKVGQCLGSVGHVGCRLASHYMLSHLIDASCHTDQSVPPVSPATPTHHHTKLKSHWVLQKFNLKWNLDCFYHVFTFLYKRYYFLCKGELNNRSCTELAMKIIWIKSTSYVLWLLDSRGRLKFKIFLSVPEQNCDLFYFIFTRTTLSTV